MVVKHADLLKGNVELVGKVESSVDKTVTEVGQALRALASVLVDIERSTTLSNHLLAAVLPERLVALRILRLLSKARSNSAEPRADDGPVP